MLTEAKPAGAARLRDDWRRWTWTVSRYALCKGRRPDAEAHAALHRRLVASCRAMAAESPGDEAFYESLDGLVRPWATPDVLARTDRELLYDLLRQCREAEQRLCGGGGRASALSALRLAAALALGMAVAAVTAVVLSSSDVAGRLTHVTYEMGDPLRRLHENEKLVLGGLGMAAVAMVVLARSLRR